MRSHGRPLLLGMMAMQRIEFLNHPASGHLPGPQWGIRADGTDLGLLAPAGDHHHHPGDRHLALLPAALPQGMGRAPHGPFAFDRPACEAALAAPVRVAEDPLGPGDEATP